MSGTLIFCFLMTAGNLASKYVASTLYKKLVDALPKLLNANESSDALEIEEITKNVSSAFEKVHEKFLEAVNIIATPVIQAGSGPNMDQSGTTATALLVTNGAVLVASLGDSRAVMSSQVTDKQTGADWKNFPTMSAIQLTHDHVASDPSERDLVVARGGSVSNKQGGIARVNGTLAITRSIGDAHLSPVLSREPHVLVLSHSQIGEQCGSVASKDNDIPCFVILGKSDLVHEQVDLNKCVS
jgi:serine/threonine protein phosphatase PrpC